MFRIRPGSGSATLVTSAENQGQATDIVTGNCSIQKKNTSYRLTASVLDPDPHSNADPDPAADEISSKKPKNSYHLGLFV